MLNENDHIDAIFLTARHGRNAPVIAGVERAQAVGRGDGDEARRWRNIRRFIRRNIA